MVNKGNVLRSPVAIQEVNFGIPLREGALDVSEPFRQAISKGIRELNISRHQLAALISELSGRNIDKNLLDKYTSLNFSYGFRAEDLPALVATMGNVEPVNTLFAPIGHILIGPEDIELLELAKKRRQREILDAEIAAIESRMEKP